MQYSVTPTALQGQDINKRRPALQDQDTSVAMSIGLQQEPLPDLVVCSRPQARRRRHPASVQTPGSLTPDTAPDTLMKPLLEEKTEEKQLGGTPRMLSQLEVPGQA